MIGNTSGKVRSIDKREPPRASEHTSQTTRPEVTDSSPWDPPSDGTTDSSPEAWDVGMNSIGARVQSFICLPGLFEHRFIRLTQYSLMRALVQNASILGLDAFLFLDDDALSPWTSSHPYPTLAPHDLSPTPVQLSTPHHPYLDVIAPPSIRDNVLLSSLEESIEDQLCCEIHLGSFTVWGSQPWNAMGM